MHVRYDNQHKTGADGTNYLGTADAVLMHRYLRLEPGAWMWNEGFPIYLMIVKYFSILFKFIHSRLDGLVVEFFFFFGGGEIFRNIFRRVCWPYYLLGLCSAPELIYLL